MCLSVRTVNSNVSLLSVVVVVSSAVEKSRVVGGPATDEDDDRDLAGPTTREDDHRDTKAVEVLAAMAATRAAVVNFMVKTEWGLGPLERVVRPSNRIEK